VLRRYLRNTLNAMPDPADSHGVETCESCGARDDHLVAVHRVYVTPEAWDTEEKIDVVDDVERWCFPCRSLYPHQEVGAA
jgi:hypothetical protein